MAWFEGRMDHAGWMQGALGGGFDSRSGDRPALLLNAPGDGLVRLIYQSKPSTLTYSKWAKFENFAKAHDNEWALARHLARGLPKSGFHERYTRYCKALVAVGPGAGADAPTGMRHELTALDNPYQRGEGEPVRIMLQYEGAPRRNAQVELFEKPLRDGGTVTLTLLRTDQDGQALVPVKPGHRYLLNAVVLQDAPAQSRWAWESHWASLSFEVAP